MSESSSWQCSFKGNDRIINFDNTGDYTYNKIRGKVRKIAADCFECNFKNPDLKVRLYRPPKENKNPTAAAVQRSLDPQSTLDLFGVVSD